MILTTGNILCITFPHNFKDFNNVITHQLCNDSCLKNQFVEHASLRKPLVHYNKSATVDKRKTYIFFPVSVLTYNLPSMCVYLQWSNSRRWEVGMWMQTCVPIFLYLGQWWSKLFVFDLPSFKRWLCLEKSSCQHVSCIRAHIFLTDSVSIT